MILGYSLGYMLYITVELVTMFSEDYCIWGSELAENISLRELQPPQLRTICYASPENLLHVLYDSTLLSFFFLPFFSFFFFLVFFPMLFVNIHKISILPSLSPNKFSFFLSLKSFFYGCFSTFQIYVSSKYFFWNSINISLICAFNTIFTLFCNQ